jgi:RNA polymerase sigma-70 factor (ECF subfamily)
MTDAAAERFEPLRATLVRHAYRMLGQYGEAEDVVQDAFLRWNDARKHTRVDDDAAFLRTTVTHLCLDRLRSARARREVYVGPWLPEPIVAETAQDPAIAATLADDVSFALLLALERLSPLERAAFLLHDVMDVPFAEIARTLNRGEDTVRKLASRGREHVHEAKRASIDRESALRLRDALLAALNADDALALERLLTEDVIYVSDGGGRAPAATVPVTGQERVSKLLIGLRRKGAALVRRVELATLNGLPGVVLFNDQGVQDAIALEMREDRVAALYVVRNPEKLRAVERAFRDR